MNNKKNLETTGQRLVVLFCKGSDGMVFHVNNHIWRLEFVRPWSDNLRRSDGSYTFGVTDGAVNKVYLMCDMSEYMTDKVLMHELSHVHAMEYHYSIPIEVEEIACDFLSLFGRSVVYMADEIMGKIMLNIA